MCRCRLFAGAARQIPHVEFIDVIEQFDEPARTVIEQRLPFLRRGKRRVSDRAARMKILGLPGEWRRALRREPAILFFDRDAAWSEIRDRIKAHMLLVARQHDRGLDCAAMNAMSQFFSRKQPRRRAEAKP